MNCSVCDEARLTRWLSKEVDQDLRCELEKLIELNQKIRAESEKTIALAERIIELCEPIEEGGEFPASEHERR